MLPERITRTEWNKLRWKTKRKDNITFQRSASNLVVCATWLYSLKKRLAKHLLAAVHHDMLENIK